MKLQILSALTILIFLAPVTQAATCATTDVTAEGVEAYACATNSGNDTGYAADINGDFGIIDTIIWNEEPIKSDALDTSLSFDSVAQTWTLTGGTFVSAPFVVVLKAGSDFASYLFTLPDIADNGTFSLIFSHLSEAGETIYYDLSHISIYTTNGVLPPDTDIFGNPVPLPAALWLFGPALLGFMGFRRKNKS